MTHPIISSEEPKNDIRNLVISTSQQMFYQQGIRQVTMDDIAKSLRMSKRTLYQLFHDKEDLLIACHQKDAEERHRQMNIAMSKTDNVIEIILRSFELTLNYMKNKSPEFIKDLTRYKRLHQYIRSERERNHEKAVEFLKKGVEQGLLRSDIQFDIVYQMSMQMCDALPQRKNLSNYSFCDIMRSTFFAYLRGCTTPAGLAIIDRFMEQCEE